MVYPSVRLRRPSGQAVDPTPLYPEREPVAPAKGLPLGTFLSGLPFASLKPGNKTLLLHFLVARVLAARIAKLLRLQPVGMLLPILGRRVIPVFAIVALQRNNFAHLG